MFLISCAHSLTLSVVDLPRQHIALLRFTACLSVARCLRYSTLLLQLLGCINRFL